MAKHDDPKRLSVLDEVVTGRAIDVQLDALVSGVAAAAGAPMALINIITEDTQFSRSYIGMGADFEARRVAPREQTFCQFVVRDELPFVVQDAAEDERVPRALAAEHGIRAYVGVPLRYQGQVIGSVCALDVVPRTFSASQVEAVEGLANYIAGRLEELRRKRKP